VHGLVAVFVLQRESVMIVNGGAADSTAKRKPASGGLVVSVSAHHQGLKVVLPRT
tara:strand:+ start:639 stop:803 length:165 start_codon:yes stop_codon:yes gene_type:complete